MYKNLLPIGSVVLLKDIEEKIMITGRIQVKCNDIVVYDYSGCFYPVGIVDSSKLFFFNRTDIESICFVGYKDEEEQYFQTEFLERLGELVVENGELKIKNS